MVFARFPNRQRRIGRAKLRRSSLVRSRGERLGRTSFQAEFSMAILVRVDMVAELERQRHPTVLLRTGQHYSTQMSEAIFKDLDLREPDYNLGVGSGSHAQQTARVMEAFEQVLLEPRPQWMVVAGDVNSTIACALVASKLQEELGYRIAHVERGGDLRVVRGRPPARVRCARLALSGLVGWKGGRAHRRSAVRIVSPFVA